jgi:hypothetical protein
VNWNLRSHQSGWSSNYAVGFDDLIGFRGHGAGGSADGLSILLAKQSR